MYIIFILNVHFFNEKYTKNCNVNIVNFYIYLYI